MKSTSCVVDADIVACGGGIAMDLPIADTIETHLAVLHRGELIQE